MFARLSRLIRSFFNQFLTAAEDPVVILENNIREMRDQIPQLNTALAKAQGSVILLTKELELLQKEEAELRAKLKAAALSNEDQIGQDIALQLQRVIEARAKQAESLKSAQAGLDSMRELRDAQIRKIRQETEKIKDAIKDSRVAKLQGELASLFETFDVGDMAYSNEDMLAKLREEAAQNQGKLEVASQTYDMKSIKLEQKAEEIQAEALYEQFKHELGIEGGKQKQEKKQKEQESVKTIG
jgi:phage shock protein A